MADVHLFGDIWRGEIDKNATTRSQVWRPYALDEQCVDLTSHVRLVQEDVYEARSGNLHLLTR